LYIGHGEIEITPMLLRALRVPADDRAKVKLCNQYDRTVGHGHGGRYGYIEVHLNHVPVGFLRFNVRGQYFWHVLREH
jgi:hypothetical protein